MKINDLDYSKSLTEARAIRIQGGWGIEMSAFSQASGNRGTYGSTATMTKVVEGSYLDGRGHARSIAYDSTGHASTGTAAGATVFGKPNFLVTKGVKTSIDLGIMSASNQDVTIIGVKY